jgi:hypothetical protein
LVLTVLAKRTGYPQRGRGHESGNPPHHREGRPGADPKRG